MVRNPSDRWSNRGIRFTAPYSCSVSMRRYGVSKERGVGMRARTGPKRLSDGEGCGDVIKLVDIKRCRMVNLLAPRFLPRLRLPVL